jgi:hypothetical protein
LGSLGVDLLPDPLLHPHSGPAGSAAHATGAVPRHLDDVDVGEGPDDLAGGQVDVVVATEITGVVVGDPLGEGRALE